MRDEALALPLRIVVQPRGDHTRRDRAHNIDTAMSAAGSAPTQGTITLAQEFEQPSTDDARSTKHWSHRRQPL
jgi:hypothetical protein